MTSDEMLDHTPFRGTKYNGSTPSVVSETEEGNDWLVWAYETWGKKPCSAALYMACKDELMERLRQRGVERDQR